MAMSSCLVPAPTAKCRSEGSEPKSDAQTPWDPSAPVTIPDTGFHIAGYIDRLDISGDGKRALVRDYKTGRPPKDNIRLDGGRSCSAASTPSP